MQTKKIIQLHFYHKHAHKMRLDNFLYAYPAAMHALSG